MEYVFDELPGLPSRYHATYRYCSSYFSKCYLGVDLESKTNIFIKHCSESKDFKREVTSIWKIFQSGPAEQIVPIIEAIPASRSGGYNYLVMPHYEGGNLWVLRRKKEGLSVEETYVITAQVGEALKRAHAAGIIHNDIKSGNIMFASESMLTAKLIDFGLSFCGVTELDPDFMFGTPEYNPPEKLNGKGPVTKAVDIYSLGLMMHEMLTNSLLYCRKLPRKEGIPPHDRIPKEVLKVIRTACEKDPANRYQNISEMMADLENAVHSKDPSDNFLYILQK
ncbi:MAG: serine/threonine-protein kinase [Nanoarchaeota archaeon]